MLLSALETLTDVFKRNPTEIVGVINAIENV